MTALSVREISCFVPSFFPVPLPQTFQTGPLVPLAANLPAAASPPRPPPSALTNTTFPLFLPFSFYLAAPPLASFFAAFHEAQHLPAVTKKSSNHPRRSSGSLSFALLLLGWAFPSAKVGREARRERQCRERGATYIPGARRTKREWAK